MKTLVVDDELSTRQLLQTFLGRYGTAQVAEDGNEAVAAVKLALEEKSPYDLICLDIMMPGMDGHATLEEIRKLEREQGITHGQGAKIIMTTALSDAENFFAASWHCDGYLVKPIDLGELIRCLNECELLS